MLLVQRGSSHTNKVILPASIALLDRANEPDGKDISADAVGAYSPASYSGGDANGKGKIG